MSEKFNAQSKLEDILNKADQEQPLVEVSDKEQISLYLKRESGTSVLRTLTFDTQVPGMSQVHTFKVPPKHLPYFFNPQGDIRGYTFETIEGKQAVVSREGFDQTALDRYGPGPHIPIPVLKTEFVQGGFENPEDVTYLSLMEQALAESTLAYRCTTARFRRLVDIDGLTGLANQGAFKRDRKKHIKWGIREKSHILLVGLDLRNLRTINNLYGHLKGDEMLEGLGPILRNCFGRENGDRVYRTGGDEFVAVVYRGIERDGARIKNQIHHATKGVKVLNQYFDSTARDNNHKLIFLENDEFIPCELSVGYKLINLCYDDPKKFRTVDDYVYETMFDEGLQKADDGLYMHKSSAKHTGLGTFMRTTQFKSMNGILNYESNSGGRL